MHQLFEDKLSDKIRTTLQNYEPPLEEASWIKMKEKLQKKQKGKIIYFYKFAKAAIILLLIGISVFFSLQLSNNKTFESKQVSEFYKLEIQKRNVENKIIDKNENIVNNSFADNSKNQNIITNKKDNINSNQNIVENNIAIFEKIENQTNSDSVVFNDINESLLAIKNNSIDCVAVVLENNIIDTTKKLNNVQIVIDESIFEEFKNEDKKESRINIGISLASNYNYADNYVSNNANFSGGITTDFRILKNLSVNTGIIFGNQNLEYGSANFLAADQESGFGDNLASKEVSSTIELYCFDIPVNVQYDIKNFFVSAGFSSYTYTSEKFESSYFTRETVNVVSQDGSLNEVGALVEENNTTNVAAFQRFDLAKLFNFSFGYSIPLKKGQIVIEPYLKYPLGELSSGEIAFGVGGMCVKYKF